MHFKQCRVDGCCTPTRSFYAVYCKAHSARLSRHGHPEQEAIDKRHLIPYLKRVEAHRRTRLGGLLWDNIETRWSIVENYAKEIIECSDRGRAMPSWRREAARSVIRVATDVKPADVVQLVLAMYLIWQDQPRLFKSDDAFKAQLVRRVRGLTDKNAGAYYDHNTGKTKCVYRDMTPRGWACMGEWIVDALGVVGIHLATAERKAAEADRKARNDFHAALAALSD